MKGFIGIVFLLINLFVAAQSVSDSSKSTFRIFLDAESCNVDLSHDHIYSEKIDEKRGVRLITANGIPEHKTGEFPNQGNPNTILAREVKYEIPLDPKPAGRDIPGMGIRTGILFSGVEIDPFTGEFFIGEKGTNRGWNITTLTTTVDLGLDCNNAHVQPSGKYHYHGTPNAYLEDLGADGTKMIKVGYAADGYPIYYKWAYDENDEIIVYESGYVLNAGDRGGDGKTAPNGVYDGTYFQDYRYEDGISELDPCNGRIGKTPESDEEYYYLITDNFPSVPICLHAEPSDDFKNRGGPQGQMQTQNQPQRGDRPNLTEIFTMMDTDKDQKISKAEVKGPLQQDFSRIDSNNDGFLTVDELQKAAPPQR